MSHFKMWVRANVRGSVFYRLLGLRVFRPRCIALSPRYSSGLSYVHNPGASPLRYQTAGEMLYKSVNMWPDREAVRSCHQNITLTYQQLIEQADALGCSLRERELEKGDRLGIWSHSCVEWIVCLFAAARAGLIPVAINPVYESSELGYCVQKVSMKGIVIGENLSDKNYYDTLRSLVPEISSCKPGELTSKSFQNLKVVISLGKENRPGCFDFNDLILRKSSACINTFVSETIPEDGFIIHFTSGTTGQPKAAIGSHFSAVNNSYLVGKRTTLDAGHERICVQVPLFHAFGTIITVMAAINHGSTLILPSGTYSPRKNAESLYTEKCTVVHGTPTMYVDLTGLVRKLRDGGRPAPAVRVALTAGAPCSPKLFHDIKDDLNANVVKSLYGLTETTAGVFQSIPGETMEQVTDTVGYVHDHLELKVVDENNRLVPFGKPGELLVRGYSTLMEYWGEAEKTRQVLSADRWFRTEDQFLLLEDGYGKIVGRLKDMIIRGGENIYPKEIEDILNTNSKIIESQVFGVEDERLGEEVCAAVRLKPGTNMTQQELVQFCKDKIAKFKVPKILKLVEDFPKTTSGKIQKFKLKKMVESGQL